MIDDSNRPVYTYHELHLLQYVSDPIKSCRLRSIACCCLPYPRNSSLCLHPASRVNAGVCVLIRRKNAQPNFSVGYTSINIFIAICIVVVIVVSSSAN